VSWNTIKKKKKPECYNRRNIIKLFGMKDLDKESVKDTEETLRNFLNKEMKNNGVAADNFSTEVDEIRKDFQPTLRNARSEQKTASFNMEKLLIRDALYQTVYNFGSPRGTFANVSVRQRPVYQRMKSICQCLMSVR